jgi:glycosyltransferase involved in cell wall biosynthesis
VAPTAAYRGWLEAHYRPRHSGHAIWNGAAASPAATGKQPFILAAGRLWDEAKNVAAITAAARELDWPVRLAGPMTPPDGRDGDAVRGLETLGTLPHDEMNAQMRHASIFVEPALYEPFGLTVLEAALCGCALVLSDIHTFRELWDGAAQFVDPCDADALAHALNRLCRDEAARKRLAQAAQARGRRYSLDVMADQYRGLYRTLHAEPKNVGRNRSRQAMELGA